jgi:hypothetical protein
MEDIARSMPLSGMTRPAWDIYILSQLGFTVSTDKDIWRKVWTIQEKTNFSSTPMFMVSAVSRKALTRQSSEENPGNGRDDVAEPV